MTGTRSFMVGYAKDFLSLGVKAGGRELPFSAVIMTISTKSKNQNVKILMSKIEVFVVFIDTMMDRNVSTEYVAVYYVHLSKIG